jgi:peptidoglycan hydrolase-like protein with peptidoglycan-binding domain
MGTRRALTNAVLVVLVTVTAAFADPGPTGYSLLDPARSGTLLRAGASGAEVTALQNALCGSCFPVSLSGTFDAATVTAVKGFQAQMGCQVDGVVGPQTMKAFDLELGINATVTPGLTRITQSQVTPQITAGAVTILNAHARQPVGSEYPFTANGQSYVGRIELHFHPYGGAEKPWGYHHGVSVYSGSIPAPYVPGTTAGSTAPASTAAKPAPAPPAAGTPSPAAPAAPATPPGTPAPSKPAAGGAARVGAIPVANMPARPASAPTGSQFMAQTANLSLTDREAQILAQLSAGNVPSFLRSYVDVTTTGGGHTLTFHVLPDYMAIGSDTDFVRIPMWAPTAQKVVDLWNGSLPTRKMVNLIWQAAPVKIAPQPIPPSAQMESNAYFTEEQAKIEAELVGKPRGQLVGGDKKDIVITNLLATNPGRVAIYGWTQLDGVPIQPLTIVHAATYADYSHGVRLVDLDVTLDGKADQLDRILEDATLSSLLSDEGPIATPRYP